VVEEEEEEQQRREAAQGSVSRVFALPSIVGLSFLSPL